MCSSDLFGTALALAVLAAVAPRLAASSIVGLSVAAPLAQAIGRMRCLVQGCCHGRETNGPGIVVRNPMSRVVSLAGLGGKPIHPTPVGSMLANAALFAILLRVVLLCPSWSLAGGLYLALGSLARFAEEGYRGEPQTRVIAGLPIYQWLAVGCFLAGLAMLAVTAPAVLVPPHLPNGADLAWAAGFGLACAVGMSVDFPDSNMRFSLLTVKAAPGTQEPDSQLPD